ncbi:MAG: hypothetical protein WDZ68_01795 [Candidatus Paceibacterota bacterium]
MDKKWNLQDIRPAGERRPKRTVVNPPQDVVTDVQRPEKKVDKIFAKSAKKSRRSLIIGLIAIFLILIPFFVIGFLLDGAKVTAYPKTREIDVNTTLEAYAEQNADELSYEVMTLEAEGERQVRATGEEEVQEQAQGQIVISNTRTTSERLVKNTRFESSNGLIFKISESAVIPAATTDDEGTVVSGTVTAQVFADETGEEYNIGPSEFTVPGYAEGGFTDLFESVTAKSNTTMQGGFEGITYIIDDAELATAKESLHAELKDALRTRVSEERPAGFIFFDSAITYSTESLPSSQSGDDMVTIKEKVLLHAPIFKESEFASFLAAATLPRYEMEPVQIEDPSVLSFGYTATSTQETDLRAFDSISFNLTGNPLIVWTFNEENLKADLANTAKTELSTVLSNYPAVERADAVIRPFWKRTFPKNTEEIDITISTAERES